MITDQRYYCYFECHLSANCLDRFVNLKTVLYKMSFTVPNLGEID